MAAYVKMIMEKLQAPQKRRVKSTRPIRKLLASFYIPVIEECDLYESVWDGESLRIGNLQDDTASVLHELAHFQVAKEKNRYLPEFGHGDSPDSFRRAKQTISSKEAPWDEALSSMLGILWEKHLGYNHQNTLAEHSWYQFDYENPKNKTLKNDVTVKTLNELYALGLISARGVPKVMINGN